MNKSSSASLTTDTQFIRSALCKMLGLLAENASKMWDGRLRVVVAGASPRRDPHRLVAEVQEVPVDDIAAPVSTETLKARGVKLQTRIDAAKALLKAREI